MNLEQLAEIAGVSKATVSSVLNGKAKKYRISEATQQKVREVAKKYDYQPNYSAASLRKGKSQLIGFIVPDFENRSYLRIAKRLEALAREQGYQLVIASSDDNPNTELQVANNLAARGVDVLLVSTSVNDVTPYRTLVKKGTPVIALDRAMPQDFINVISDDRHGAFELTNAVVDPSMTSICLIGAHPELTISQLRTSGFEASIAQYPELSGHVFYGDNYDVDSGRETLRRALLELSSLPQAIVATSYSLLEGVIELLQRDYPEVLEAQQIKLATFGNSRLLDFLPFPVISMPQQYEQIAESAWRISERAIAGNYDAQQVIIGRTIIRR